MTCTLCLLLLVFAAAPALAGDDPQYFIESANHQFRPIRPTATSDFNMAGADWNEWVAKTPTLVEKGPAADEHFQKERVSKRLDKLYAKAVEAWNARTDAEKAELTLAPADAAPL